MTLGFVLWVSSRVRTQAQRPGARDATLATATLPPGSPQRMVRRHPFINDHGRHKSTSVSNLGSNSPRQVRDSFSPSKRGEQYEGAAGHQEEDG